MSGCFLVCSKLNSMDLGGLRNGGSHSSGRSLVRATGNIRAIRACRFGSYPITANSPLTPKAEALMIRKIVNPLA